MEALEERSPNWDAVSVVGVLRDWNRLKRCGGTAYVIGLLRDGQPAVIPETARRHAARIVTLWRWRTAQRALASAAVAIAEQRPAAVLAELAKELGHAGISMRAAPGRMPGAHPDDVRGGGIARTRSGVPTMLRPAHKAPEGIRGSPSKTQNAPPTETERSRTRSVSARPKVVPAAPSATQSASRASSRGSDRKPRETRNGTASTAASRPCQKPSGQARA